MYGEKTSWYTGQTYDVVLIQSYVRPSTKANSLHNCLFIKLSITLRGIQHDKIYDNQSKVMQKINQDEASPIAPNNEDDTNQNEHLAIIILIIWLDI